MNSFILMMPIVTLIGYRTYIVMQMKHFKIGDFRGMHPFLTRRLLESLDAFAGLMKPKRVIISPAKGTIYRFPKDGVIPKNRDHYTGNAVDVMIPDGPAFIDAVRLARRAGFNAIGIYPYWNISKGMHLAVRKPYNRQFAWSDVGRGGKHKYTSIDRGYQYG